MLLLCGVLHAQTPTQQKADEKTLETVYAAREQADQFLDLAWDSELKKAIAGDSKAGELANKIDDDRKRQQRWEVSAWSLSNSALRPGESIESELGNGVVAVRGTIQTAISRGLPVPPSTAEPDQKIDKPAHCCVYMVKAPPEIRSRILVEGLRHDLKNFAAILQFDGKSAESDGFWVSWKSAWFDAQEVFCKYNQGAQFIDLNGEAQTCKTSSSVQSKPHD
jgi:hypothetical protein